MKKGFIILAITFLVILLMRKKIGNRPFGSSLPKKEKDSILSALREIVKKYGIETARTVERMYRFETRHFLSEAFRNTLGAGMEKHKANFPFGWSSLSSIWKNEPDLAPVGMYSATEGKGLHGDGGKAKVFLKFGSILAGMVSVAEYLQRYRAGRWYAGTDNKRATDYENILKKISPRFVDSL